MSDSRSDLVKILSQLSGIYESISKLSDLPIRRYPILDSSVEEDKEDWLHRQVPSGINKLKDNVKIDHDVLQRFLDDPKSSQLPPLSTNAPYLVAVWHEYLCAKAVVAIFKSFSFVPVRGKRDAQKPPGAKVDIVADGGQTWMRINTIKNARLSAEFREQDSYLTDSSDDESSDAPSVTLAPTEFDNSILRMGSGLVRAAKANPMVIHTELGVKQVIPRITLRLTRLDTTDDSGDPRIRKTVQCLRDMGITVDLGERKEDELPVLPKPSTIIPAPMMRPTQLINIDLSILIALASDLTHADLPASVEEANKRFVSSQQDREWKKKPNNVDSDDQAKHSRALTNQLLQEMSKGLLQELRDQLSAVNLSAIEFWTTSEAKERCLRIVSKIGGENEKRRAQALFSANGHTDYWSYSRFSPDLIQFLPVKIFPSDITDDISSNQPSLRPIPQPDAFFQALHRTCGEILEMEDEPSHGDTGGRATTMKANARLTRHTVLTLEVGAQLGWTTLTANRTSVKAMLREISGTIDLGQGAGAIAAIWLVDPRSLAEGMRDEASAETI
ncbi:hypothetical protein C8J56DRAFT_926220 [Mycena floridula]|nr:hypothetical protein C8J56DRAFT_926220 [Mycena floridula]